MALKIDPEVNNAFDRLVHNQTSWIMATYSDNSCTKLQFQGEGIGGMPEFIATLPEAEVAWGAFKVVGVDDRGNTVSRRPKYIFVKWVPAEGITAIKRAKVGRHKGDIKRIINAPIDFEVDCKEDFNEDTVIRKLRASGGAHQPTSYEFADYSL